MKKLVLLILFFFLPNEYTHANENTDELCKEGQIDCTFVLLSEVTNQTEVINRQRAQQSFSPFSTFKIANTLIALDKGLITSTEQVLTYDHIKYPTQNWWPSVWRLESYNLSSAFKYSMVPIYRQIATSVGIEDMNSYLQKFSYGNQDISSGLDDFWLNGSMKISAYEQVQFLQNVYHNKYSLHGASVSQLKEVMLVESTENYKIYAKTGAGKGDDKSMLGWYVGFVENKKGIHYFAFNVNRKTYAEMKSVRVTMAMSHLRKLGVI